MQLDPQGLSIVVTQDFEHCDGNESRWFGITNQTYGQW